MKTLLSTSVISAVWQLSLRKVRYPLISRLLDKQLENVRNTQRGFAYRGLRLQVYPIVTFWLMPLVIKLNKLLTNF